MEKRKEILEKVLELIEKEKEYNHVSGLCALTFLESYEYEMAYYIKEDIQEANQIRFKPGEFYEPFCEKKYYEIITPGDIKLWYEKRIEAVQNTIDYYNNKLK
jgi:hypothetical protein